jgi:hypothetical protein
LEPDDPRHGTRAGYGQHQREAGGGSACEPCRLANASYQSATRLVSPTARKVNRFDGQVRQLATRRLIDAHRSEYEGLLRAARVQLKEEQRRGKSG